MLLYFALDDEDTCFHSSKIFNNLEELYNELMDYRKNVHFVSDDITSLSFDILKFYVGIFTEYYYREGTVVTSIRCSIVSDECGNFGYDFVTVTFDDESELRL